MTDKTKNQNGMSFTLFIILPTDDVCSLRNLTSGVMIREIRCRLELTAGFAAQIYRLTSPDGKLLHEEHSLVLDHNVWDGYILRVNIFDSWLDLFQWVVHGNIDQVYKNGGVCLKKGSSTDLDEEAQSKTEDVIHERGLVALFLASFYGLAKMCQMLIAAGVDVNGKTSFDNRPLHAACCKDNERVVDVLIHHGASVVCKNSKGDTPIDVAKKSFSKNCFRKLRMYQLKINGVVSSRRVSSGVVRTTNLSFSPHPPSSQRPQTSRPRRNTPASQELPLKDATSPRPSQEYYMWDTDDPKSRPGSATKFRVGSPSSLNAVLEASNVVSRVGIAPSKPTVKWGETRSRVITSAIKRQDPGRQPVQPQRHSILKNGVENRSFVEFTCTVDSGSSQQDSESFSVASVPNPRKDSSVVGGCNVRSAESAPDLQQAADLVPHPPKLNRAKSSSVSGRRTRILISRQRENESWKTMKRKINLAANQKQFERDLFPQKTKESFDDWLARKRREEKRDIRETDSDESETESESKARNAQAFGKWMRRQRGKGKHGSDYVTVTDIYLRRMRPLKGLIRTDSELQNQTPTDPSSNITAYRDWREKHAKQEKGSRVGDLKFMKEKLEEKRQRLLEMAISYDEWMEHTEDRKTLMKEILQASMEQLNRIEEDKLKCRAPRQISFHDWNEKTKPRAAKGRKAMQAVDVEDPPDLQPAATSVTYTTWMRRKKEVHVQREEMSKQQQILKQNPPDSDKEAAYKNWVRRNNQGEPAQMLTRERRMMSTMKDKHKYTVSSC